MRIVVDLDGVICTTKKEKETYADVQPIPGAIEKLTKWKAEGHYIIIHTARHMKTTSSNYGLIMAKVGKITLDWLHQHEIPFDEIYFGKPYGDVYIDDKGVNFKDWSSITLPVEYETRV